MLILQKRTGFSWDSNTAVNMNINGDIATYNGALAKAIVKATVFKSTGKNYYEWALTASGGPGSVLGGIGSANVDAPGTDLAVGTAIVYYPHDGNIYKDGVYVAGPFPYTALGNTVGVAYDADLNTVEFFLDGVAIGGTISYNPGVAISPVMGGDQSTQAHEGTAKFFAPFDETVPSGFEAWV